MYIWRIPVTLAAVLANASVLLCTAEALLFARRRASTAVLRGLIASALLLAFALSGPGVEALIQIHKRATGIYALYIDPSLATLSVPAIIVLALMVLGHFTFPVNASASTAQKRWLFEAIGLLFIALNSVNGCSPGWCERFGFPLPYFEWSDGGQLPFDGTPPSPWSWFGALFDVATFLGGTAAAAVAFRRRTTDGAA